MGCTASGAPGCISGTLNDRPEELFTDKGSQACFHECYTLEKKLGSGAFGQVRAATHRGGSCKVQAGQKVAVKILDLCSHAAQKAQDAEAVPLREANKRLQRLAQREGCCWQQVGKHENIVELMEAFFEQGVCYMVMERCRCCMMDMLRARSALPKADLRRIFRQMLMSVRVVHERGIVHRDIKPDNFLMGGQDGDTVKLCDFGVAAAAPRDGGHLSGFYGTAPFASPEMAAEKGHSFPTDLWSLGATLYVIIFGEFPYQPEKMNFEGMKSAVASGKPAPKFKQVGRLRQYGELPEDTVDFVRIFMNRRPDKRASPEEAMRHQFLQSPEEMEELVLDDDNNRQLRSDQEQFKPKEDRILQRGLEEMLQHLQMKFGCESGQFFSEGDLNGEGTSVWSRKTTLSGANVDDVGESRIVAPRSPRFLRTHSGVILEAAVRKLSLTSSSDGHDEEEEDLQNNTATNSMPLCYLGQKGGSDDDRLRGGRIPISSASPRMRNRLDPPKRNSAP